MCWKSRGIMICFEVKLPFQLLVSFESSPTFRISPEAPPPPTHKLFGQFLRFLVHFLILYYTSEYRRSNCFLWVVVSGHSRMEINGPTIIINFFDAWQSKHSHIGLLLELHMLFVNFAAMIMPNILGIWCNNLR